MSSKALDKNSQQSKGSLFSNFSNNTKKIKLNPRKRNMDSATTMSYRSNLNSQSALLKKDLKLVAKIAETRLAKEQKMADHVAQCIIENLHIYKMYRNQFKPKITEFQKERVKIQNRKKSVKYKFRKLVETTRGLLAIFVKALQMTALHFKKLYYESDHYRGLRLNNLLMGIDDRQEETQTKFNMAEIAMVIHDKRKQSLESMRDSSSRSKSRSSQNLAASGKNLKKGSLIDIDGGGESSGSRDTSPLSISGSRGDNHKGMHYKNGRWYSNKSAIKISNALLKKQQGKIQLTEQQNRKNVQSQIKDFFNSFYRNDRIFALNFIKNITREKFDEKVEDTVNKVFYDKFFNVILESDDNLFVDIAFDIVINLINSESQRKKLLNNGYLAKIYKRFDQIADEIIGKKGQDSPSPIKLIKTEIDETEESPKSPTTVQDIDQQISPEKIEGSDDVFKQQDSPETPKMAAPSPTIKSTILSPDSPPQKKSGGTQFQKRMLHKLSWLTVLISFNIQKETEEILKLDLFPMIMKFIHADMPSNIRSKGVLAISLLSHCDRVFELIIKLDLIDIILELAMNPNQDKLTQQYSTQALVHFAFNNKSVDLLIEKGVMDIFKTFRQKDEMEIANNKEQLEQLANDKPHLKIRTNISWIFLVLCNNKISSKNMLEKGVTRDMFIIACNPIYKDIRNLIITAFAQLGRNTDIFFSKQINLSQMSDDTNVRAQIKNKAIYRQQFHMREKTQENIDILLQFVSSDSEEYQLMALQSLKDYLFLNYKYLVGDISVITGAFLVGSISDNVAIQLVAANAISFLITHRIVYKDIIQENVQEQDKITLQASHTFGRAQQLIIQEDALGIKKKLYKARSKQTQQHLRFYENQSGRNILDAVMHLSGSNVTEIRSTAFSSLSTLSDCSSQNQGVLSQIFKDISIPTDLPQELQVYSEQLRDHTNQYSLFVYYKLFYQREVFRKFQTKQGVETAYSGLYSLLKLTYNPSDIHIETCMDDYLKFIQVMKNDIEEQNKERAAAAALIINQENDNTPNSQKSRLTQNSEFINDEQRSNIEKHKRIIMLEKKQNEIYFIDVFLSLMHCESPDIQLKLLQVIQFYSVLNINDNELSNTFKSIKGSFDLQQTAECQDMVINSTTILWLLQIIQGNMDNKYLSCLCSLTLLGIVEKHSIDIDYHEQAIVKAFNNILQRLEFFTANNDSQSQAINGQAQQSHYGLGKSYGSQQDSIEECDLDDESSSQNKADKFEEFSDKSSSSHSLESSPANLDPKKQFSFTPNKDFLTKELYSNQRKHSSSSVFQGEVTRNVKFKLEPKRSKSFKSYGSEEQQTEQSVSKQSEDLEKDITDAYKAPYTPNDMLRDSSQGKEQFQGVKIPELKVPASFRVPKSVKRKNSPDVLDVQKRKISTIMEDDAENSPLSPDKVEDDSISRLDLVKMSPSKHLKSSLSPIQEDGNSRGPETFAKVQQASAFLKQNVKKLTLKQKRERMKKTSKSQIMNITMQSNLFFKKKTLTKSVDTDKLDQIRRSSIKTPSSEFSNVLKLKKMNTQKPKISTKKLCDLITEEPSKEEKKYLIESNGALSCIESQSDGNLESSENKSTDNKKNKKPLQLSPQKIKDKSDSGSHSSNKSNTVLSVSSQNKKDEEKKESALESFKTDDKNSDEDSDSSNSELSEDEEEFLRDNVACIKYVMSLQHVFEREHISETKKGELSQSESSLIDSEIEDANQNIDNYLRDSIIKSFMIVFTSESSQHLLLNKDLIEIACNCMEYSTEITTEAQIKNSKLTSQLSKFPRVQNIIIQKSGGNVIKGMSNLINLVCKSNKKIQNLILKSQNSSQSFNSEDHAKKQILKTKKFINQIDILSNLINAFYKISKNPLFVNDSEKSRDVLNSMIDLLRCKYILSQLEHADIFHVMLIIKNIQNGSNENCEQFYNYGGCDDLYNILNKGLRNLLLDEQDHKEIEKQPVEIPFKLQKLMNKLEKNAVQQQILVPAYSSKSSVRIVKTEFSETGGVKISTNSALVATTMHMILNEEVETKNLCLHIYLKLLSKKSIVLQIIEKDESRSQIIQTIKKCISQSTEWNLNQIYQLVKEYGFLPDDPNKKIMHLNQRPVMHQSMKLKKINPIQFKFNQDIEQPKQGEIKKRLSMTPSYSSNRVTLHQKLNIDMIDENLIGVSDSENSVNSTENNFDKIQIQLIQEEKDKLRQKQRDLAELYKRYKLQTIFIDMRKNVYSMLSRIAKFGLSDPSKRQDIEEELLVQIDLIPVIIQDLDTLCILMQQNKEVIDLPQLPNFEKQDDDPSEEPIPDDLHAQQIIMYSDFFSSIIQCLRAIQSNSRSIHMILDEEQHHIGSKNCKSPLNRLLNILNNMSDGDHLKKLDLANLIGNILMEKIQNSVIDSESQIVKNVAQVLQTLLDLIECPVPGKQSIEQDEIQISILYIFSKILSILKNGFKMDQDFANFLEITISDKILELFNKNLDQENNKIILLTLQIIEFSIKSDKILLKCYDQPEDNTLSIGLKVKLMLRSSTFDDKEARIQTAITNCFVTLNKARQNLDHEDPKQKADRKFLKQLIKIALEKDYLPVLDPEDQDASMEDNFDLDSQISDELEKLPTQQEIKRINKQIDKIGNSPRLKHPGTPNRSKYGKDICNYSNISMAMSSYAQGEEYSLSDDSEKENESFEKMIQSLATITTQMAENVDLKYMRYMMDCGIITLCAKILGIFETYSNLNDPMLNLQQFIDTNMKSESQSMQFSNSFDSQEKKGRSLDLMIFKVGAIELARNMTIILKNFASTAQQQMTEDVSIKDCLKFTHLLIAKTNFLKVLKNSMKLIELEVQTNLIKTIGNLLILRPQQSQEKYDIQILLISNDIMGILIQNLEKPAHGIVTISTLCQKYLKRIQKTDSHLFQCYLKYEKYKEQQEAQIFQKQLNEALNTGNSTQRGNMSVALPSNGNGNISLIGYFQDIKIENNYFNN